MAKKILVMVEYGEDNTYSCYSETAIGDYALIDGDGNTVAEAKADFLRAVEECREIYPDTPIRNKQFFFFLKKVSIKAEKEDCFFVYLLLIINYRTK